jgi:hypothetical protein
MAAPHLDNNPQKGFSTLLLVIILGAASLGLMLALSTSSFWAIRGSTNAKNSDQAKALANACAETTLESMRENNSYLGSGSITIGNNSCAYSVTSLGGSARSVAVSGAAGAAVRKINITTGSFNPITISLWQEVP